MRRLFRTMLKDGDGLPRVGRSARMLGVRVEGRHADVAPDDRGHVHPMRGGMSVTVDDPARMPVFLRPPWLDLGASEDPLFWLDATQVSDALTVRRDAGAHALVEPTEVMALAAYETALASTRTKWREELP